MLIRPATVDDMAAVEAARIATWKVAYRGMIPDDHLDAMEVRTDRVAWMQERLGQAGVETHVAAVDGAIVGMAVAGPCRDEDLLGVPELYGLYVLPERWRSGAGSTLLAACGDVETLWVLEANDQARSFYERRGFAPDGTAKGRDFGVPVTEVRYRLIG